VIVAKECIFANCQAKNADRFPEGNSEQVRSMKTAYGCCNGIKVGILCCLELLDAEVAGTLVKTETNVYRLNIAAEIEVM
jgi:hypothetical protein